MWHEERFQPPHVGGGGGGGGVYIFMFVLKNLTCKGLRFYVKRPMNDKSSLVQELAWQVPSTKYQNIIGTSEGHKRTKCVVRASMGYVGMWNALCMWNIFLVKQ